MVDAKQKTAAEMLKSAYGQPSAVRPDVPAELASAVNLMAHPLAGIAAVSAIGFGIASHTMGMWAAALAGAAAASQRLAPSVLARPVEPDADATLPAVRARLAVVTSLADAREAAKQSASSDAKASEKVEPAAQVAVEMPAQSDGVGGIQAPVAKVGTPVEAFQVPDQAKARKPTVARVKPVAEGSKSAVRVKPSVVAPAVHTVSNAQPAAIARPSVVDDLKAISGIGPKLEKVLNGLGIWTYAQIAGWTHAEIGWVDDRLGFSGRIGRDDWTGQAAALSGSKRKA